MIAVSNEFKKAIKSDERRIKGYVEVIYDVPDIETTPTADYSSTYTNINEIDDGRRVENNYASFDYLPLDGTRLSVLDGINTNAGYISDDIFEDIQNPTIDLTFESSTIQGVTIYFKDNYPTNMTLEFSDLSSITVEPDNEIVQVIFDEPKTITSVSITINEMQYSDRKIKIQEVDLGISYVYQDQDLIEFTVDEEVNKLVEEVPTNETSITINNMQDLFNPLNPQGVVKYLTDGSKIIPYIGVLTETQGVEFVKMGEFFFDSYTNNSDKTTTLVGKNIIKQIEAREITDGLVGATSGFIDFADGTSPNLTTDILTRLGYSYEFNPTTRIPYNLNFLESINLMEFFKNITIHDYSIFYTDRNNKLIFRSPISNSIEILTKSDLLNDVEYKKLERINTIKRISTRQTSQAQNASGTNTTIFSSADNQYVIKKSPQNIAVKNNVARNIWQLTSDLSFTYSGATNAQIKYGSSTYTIIQVSGTIGNTVSLNCTYNNHTVTNQTLEQTYLVSNKQEGEPEKIIENNMPFNAYPGRVKTDLGQLEYTPSYEINFEYNGDPSLEAGDYIEVETPYGYKPVFIQKNRFTFNGGLSGSIEGVE